MFFTKTVDGVVKSLQDIIDDLDGVYSEQNDKIAVNQQKIDIAKFRIEQAGVERARAAKIKAKLEALLA